MSRSKAFGDDGETAGANMSNLRNQIALDDGIFGTKPDSIGPVDLKRMAPAAWRAFFRIMKAWRVPDHTACQLLSVPVSTMQGIRMSLTESREIDALNRDQATRIGLMIGITKILRHLHSKRLADEWMTLPNKHATFSGKTPLEYAQREGTLGLETIYKMLSARGGIVL